MYQIRPTHNAVGAFDLDGAYDERSDRIQPLGELMERGYEDAYRQFIEPVRRRVGRNASQRRPPSPRRRMTYRRVTDVQRADAAFMPPAYSFQSMGKHTELIHRGERPPRGVDRLTTPIYETSTFVFDSARDVERYQDGSLPAYLYSRYENPTIVAVGRKAGGG